MAAIKLPDGSIREYQDAISVAEVAADIGSGLAKAALAGIVNGKAVDLSYLIIHDAELSIITAKDPLGLEIIRHSTAHLMAQAVKQLYPSAQVTIGPVIENGFYYDFAHERAFTLDDLEKIEAKMTALAQENLPVTMRTLTRQKAIEYFEGIGEHYKVDIIKDIPTDEALSLYTQGDFTDLCRGPHVPRTGLLKAFKLMKVAGAYWRGDADNEMLTRVYGTAWGSKKELESYLIRLEEAEKRDHRKLAKSMDLFHTQEISPGQVFWHPNGWTLYTTIADYMSAVWRDNGYQQIRTPVMADKSLWERSGHWDKFREEMFVTESEQRTYAIKPMNCPCHVQIFNQGLKSYRDLPLRLAEFGACHRDEPSGTLHGLMRIRGFVQDDAHIFCSEDMIQAEVVQFNELLFKVYKDFGFENIIVRLSTRPEKRIGSDDIWDRAEKALADALDSQDIVWQELPGEGAFYGPKIEFSLKDCLDRVWQCGTMQVDFSMPGRLDAYYIAEDGSKQVPVMLHRAILGSMERFIGVLIEHYAGNLPLWLSPVQVVVMNITDKQADYVRKITEKLQKHGIRAKFDLRNEKIGFKIREHSMSRVSYLVVVGDRELESQTLAIRKQNGDALGTFSLEDFCQRLQKEIAEKALTIEE